jgi:phosphoglycerol transferase MdoB-like AlkP superfamily enzyme
MEKPDTSIGTLIEKTENYMKSSAELYKLKAIDKSADVISTLTLRLVIVVFMSLIFLILNTGIALWAGEKTGKSYYGFFIVSGFYIIIGIVLYFFRNRWIKAPLRNSIITQFLN